MIQKKKNPTYCFANTVIPNEALNILPYRTTPHIPVISSNTYRALSKFKFFHIQGKRNKQE